GTALLPEPYVACGLMPAALLATLLADDAAAAAAAPWCGPIAQGHAVAALAWQEAAGQTGLDPLATTLRAQAGGEWHLHGVKRFVPAAATVLFVSARLDGAPALVAVPAGAPGIRGEPTRMADGSV